MTWSGTQQSNHYIHDITHVTSSLMETNHATTDQTRTLIAIAYNHLELWATLHGPVMK